MLVKVNRDGKMPIKDLWRLVLKFIFDNKNSGYGAKHIIETNIESWYAIVKEQNSKIVDVFGEVVANAQPIGRKGTVTDEIEYQLQAMCKLLVLDEEGKLEYKKETFRDHKIDYRKTVEFGFAFPEMRPVKADYLRAQAALKKNNEDNKNLLN